MSLIRKLIIFCYFFHVSKAQCIKDSFDIKLSDLTGVYVQEYLSIMTVGFYVSTNQNNPVEYTKNCLEKITFNIQSIHGNRNEDLIFKPEDINKMTSYSIENLLSLTDYTILVGYKLVNNNEIVNKLKFTETICLTRPNKPENVIVDSNGASLILKWNAPSSWINICYYNISTVDTNTNTNNFQTNQTEFYFPDKSFLNKVLSISIRAIYDIQCYKDKYPLASKCELKKVEPTESNITLIVYRPTTTAITTTKKANISNCFDPSIILIFIQLICFFLSF